MGDSSSSLVNMNALIVIGLCALSANAVFIPYPYGHNLFNPAAFTSGVVAPITYAARNPITIAPQPITYTTAAVAPVVAPSPTLTKFHAQDELGQYNFGHFGGPSSRNEVRDAFGVVRGQVNYIDANGEVQQQNYVADALGFRVAATNLPVAPDAPEEVVLKPVEDTPEVTQAKTAHLQAVEDAKARAAPAPSRKKREVGSVAIHSAVAPISVAPTSNAVAPPAFVAPRAVYAPRFTYSGHAVAPPAFVNPGLTYAAGHAVAPRLTYAATGNVIAPGATYYGAASPITAARDATLLRVENNPGHAVLYLVFIKCCRAQNVDNIECVHNIGQEQSC